MLTAASTSAEPGGDAGACPIADRASVFVLGQSGRSGDGRHAMLLRLIETLTHAGVLKWQRSLLRLLAKSSDIRRLSVARGERLGRVGDVGDIRDSGGSG
jgi:hypothetical protein